MAKSKQRKGHRQRVEARNQKLKSAQTKMQKLFNEAIQKQVEEMKAKQSGETETTEVTEVINEATNQEIIVTEQ